MGSPITPTSQIPLTSTTINLPKLDIPIQEQDLEIENHSNNEEEIVEQIITQEPEINNKMTEPLTLEFEAEYHFTHKGIMYQGYIDLTQSEAAYQKEIDICIPGLQGEELAAVKLAFGNSLHFYPKKDRDKF